MRTIRSNWISLCALLLAITACTPPHEARVASPDGRVETRFRLDANGCMIYDVSFLAHPIVMPSGLGFARNVGDTLACGFEVNGVERRSVDHTWRPPYGERAEVRDRYNEIAIEVERMDEHPARLELVFRAYDEGVGFRYRILEVGDSSTVSLPAELTSFRLPPRTYGYEEHGTEGEYARVPVDSIQPGCERPLTLEYERGIFASLTEAQTIDYPRMLLSTAADASSVLTTDLDGPIRAVLPFETPWRVFVLGERPGDLLEHNDIILNLNPPSTIADPTWIRPGTIMREVTLSTEGGKRLVDFAVERGIDHIEYDAGWYGHEHDDAADATTVTPDPDRTRNVPDYAGLDLQEVIRYARDRDIGVWLYVNRRALETQMDTLFSLFESWGVSGVKFGFVRVGPQEWTRWVHDAVRRAADHRLMVDIHDAYRPTGFSRTYPNLLTQEGVRGNEHMPTARHNVTLPFTRAVAGAADYTICYYSDRIKTTRAHQLAQSVVSYSPLQFLFWYDRPSDYGGEPEVAFFEDLPTVWDETLVLHGEIGAFISVARRSGERWYVGSLSNEKARVLEVRLDFLRDGLTYRAEIFTDGDVSSGVGAAVDVTESEVDARSVLTAELSSSGGQAVRITPAGR